MRQGCFEMIYEAMASGARRIMEGLALRQRLEACDCPAEEGRMDPLDPRARRVLVPEAVHMAFCPGMI